MRTGTSPSITLMQLWRQHREECRSISAILEDARSGKLSGIEPAPSGFGFVVTDKAAAKAGMRAM